MTATTYLDYNATAPMRPSVVDAMLDVMRSVGNASSVHRFGRSARRRVEEARAAVAGAIGAPAACVVFTSGGTEANRMALQGCGRQRIMASAIEHASVLENCGLGTVELPVLASGIVDLAALERLLAQSDVPALVCVMAANNETGVIQPIEEAARLAHRHGALIHCDAVQAVGRMAVDWTALDVDYLSLSAHKFGGPQGVGALVVREGAPLAPTQRGGGQERSRRAGTENVAGIVGLGVAIAEAANHVEDMGGVTMLRDVAQSRLLALAPKARVFGIEAPRLPNTLCVEMPGVSSEVQVMALDLAGVAVSAGAACSSGKVRPSPVLRAMGASDEQARSAIRVSFGRESKLDDVDRLVAAWGALWVRTGGAERAQSGTAA